MTKKVGKFEIEVSSPYPCWVYLTHDGGQIATQLHFHHGELLDLKYAVEAAIRSAKLQLGDRAGEVE